MRNLTVDGKHDALIFELLNKISNLFCTSYKYVESSEGREIVAYFDNSGIFFTKITNFTAFSCKFIKKSFICCLIS